jgi:hypothetical protein
MLFVNKYYLINASTIDFTRDTIFGECIQPIEKKSEKTSSTTKCVISQRKQNVIRRGHFK